MVLRNPRKFSRRIAVVVGVSGFFSYFFSMCFEYGCGRFLGGVGSAAAHVLFHTLFGGFLFFVAIAGVAVLVGRVIGTTITAVLAVGLLALPIVSSYRNSQPIARFRALIWKAAPESLQIDHHKMYTSFNDGTTYTFIVTTEPPAFRKICDGAKLNPVPSDDSRWSNPSWQKIQLSFSPQPFPRDVEIYGNEEIHIAYTPSQKKAFIARWPLPRPSD